MVDRLQTTYVEVPVTKDGAPIVIENQLGGKGRYVTQPHTRKVAEELLENTAMTQTPEAMPVKASRANKIS